MKAVILKIEKEIPYIDNFSCPQQYQRMTIGADGLVMKCDKWWKKIKKWLEIVKTQTVHEIWHGEKLNKMREMHNKEKGFMCSEVCKRCYLPRKTQDDIVKVGNREIIVKNYINRSQIIGK